MGGGRLFYIDDVIQASSNVLSRTDHKNKLERKGGEDCRMRNQRQTKECAEVACWDSMGNMINRV